ncbi:MAG: hypothetical protein CME66_12635 [Halobacteriovoraceae bacterium]|nr:hypothetical protein [Halobacteriovoraceae bacterium]
MLLPRKNFLQDLIFWNISWYPHLNALLTPLYVAVVPQHQNSFFLGFKAKVPADLWYKFALLF